MSRGELEMGLDWAAEEGWNPGLHDGDSFYSADPDGFLLGLQGNEPVGMVSAVRYGATFGFIGMFIVRPAFRGQGFGRSLWEAALQRLSGRTVGLDGVVAQQDNYRKAGFVLAHHNTRYEGTVSAPADPEDPRVVPAGTLGTAALVCYDRPFFAEARPAFLESWVAQTGSVALAWVEDGRLAGLGVARPCRSGAKIGPLAADRADIARTLRHALAARRPPGELLQLDVPVLPGGTGPGPDLARALGLTSTFATARMYTGGPAPALDLQRLYGISTLELG